MPASLVERVDVDSMPTTKSGEVTAGQNAPVLLEKSGGVVKLIFNRPESLNAISPEFAECFLEKCREIEQDDGCRAVLLCGAGRAFMAGGDLSRFHSDFENAPSIATSMIVPMNTALSILSNLPIPVIARLHGAVAGAGMSVAMACDLAIAAERTVFSFGYTQIGASPDLGLSWRLPNSIGLRRAMGLALMGQSVNAEEALRIGLINKVVEGGNLIDVTDALLERLANGPTVSYAKTKCLMRGAADRGLTEQVNEELVAFIECSRTQDFITGVSAFIDKSKTVNFAGR